MNSGFIKLYRSLIDKSIWVNSTLEQRVILITLLFMANYRANKWEFGGEIYELQPGQLVTSINAIVERCNDENITTQKVRTALLRFEKLGFLTNKSTNKNRLITIVNWGKYQNENTEDNKQSNRQLTSNQQATNKQLTGSQQAANKQLTTKEESNKVRKKEGKERKENNNTSLCSEPFTYGESSEQETEPPVISLVLNTGEEYSIYNKDLIAWTDLYPAVDVMQQLRNMKGWLDSNPTRRKTKKGIRRFINSWLQKEQDRGGVLKKGSNNDSDDWKKMMEEWANGE